MKNRLSLLGRVKLPLSVGQGFTLVELVACLIIMGILGAGGVYRYSQSSYVKILSREMLYQSSSDFARFCAVLQNRPTAITVTSREISVYQDIDHDGDYSHQELIQRVPTSIGRANSSSYNEKILKTTLFDFNH